MAQNHHVTSEAPPVVETLNRIGSFKWGDARFHEWDLSENVHAYMTNVVVNRYGQDRGYPVLSIVTDETDIRSFLLGASRDRSRVGKAFEVDLKKLVSDRQYGFLTEDRLGQRELEYPDDELFVSALQVLHGVSEKASLVSRRNRAARWIKRILPRKYR